MPSTMTQEALRFSRSSPRRRAAFVTIVPFFMSLLMLAGGIIMVSDYSIAAVCTRVLLWPMVAIGLLLMATYCCGCNSIRHDDECLGILYFIGLCMSFVAILAFVIFGYIAVGGIDFSPIKVREYKLTGYRGWLRGRVADPQYWSTISACLQDMHACRNMGQLVRDPKTGSFVPKRSRAKLMDLGDGPMPIESGCCKPPSSCGFTYVNRTTWIPTPGAPAVDTNVDCSRWSNEPQTLCFHCDSCRAGLLNENIHSWTIGAVFPFIALIGLSLSCCLIGSINN